MNQLPRMVSLTARVSPGDHIRGFKGAKVTVVEYGDFECAACGQAYHAVKMLLDRFGDRICFVFRHFPQLELHARAESAAEAAESAGGQHKFWQMHDLLLENQTHLQAINLKQYATKAELDLGRFDHEMHDHLYLQRLQQDIESGLSSHVQCTPAFFVNGVLSDVSAGLYRLEQAIEDELVA